jgi:hypothetical protein
MFVPEVEAPVRHDPQTVRRVRAQLEKELAEIQAAQSFPWRNLTVALGAEQGFVSLAGHYLPMPEAHKLCAAYSEEIDRVYEMIDEGWVPLYRQLGLFMYAGKEKRALGMPPQA